MLLLFNDSKVPACNVGDPGLIPGSGRSPGEGNGSTPALLSGKSRGRRSLIGYSPWGRKESDMTEQLSLHFSSADLVVFWPEAILQEGLQQGGSSQAAATSASVPVVSPCQHTPPQETFQH